MEVFRKVKVKQGSFCNSCNISFNHLVIIQISVDSFCHIFDITSRFKPIYIASAVAVDQFIQHYVQVILLKLFLQYVHIQINQYVTTSAVAREE